MLKLNDLFYSLSIAIVLVFFMFSCQEAEDLPEIVDYQQLSIDSANYAESKVDLDAYYRNQMKDSSDLNEGIYQPESEQLLINNVSEYLMFYGNLSNYRRVNIKFTNNPYSWPSSNVASIIGSRVIKGPDAVQFKGKYYVTYATDRDVSNLLYPIVHSSSTLGNSWTRRAFWFNDTNHAPAIASKGDTELWLAWTFNNKIYTSKSTDGTNWSSTSSFTVPNGASGNLDLTYVNGAIIAYYASSNGNIYSINLSNYTGNATLVASGDLPRHVNGNTIHVLNSTVMKGIFPVRTFSNTGLYTTSVLGLMTEGSEQVLAYRNPTTSNIHVAVNSGFAWSLKAYIADCTDGVSLIDGAKQGYSPCNFSNLARCATVSPSTTYGGHSSGYTAQNTIDGDRNTTVGPFFSWTNQSPSNGGSLPETITYDLQVQTSVRRVVLYTSSGYEMSKYKIQYSNNNATWTNLVSVDNNTSVSRTHTFSAVNARYIRIYCERGPAVQTTYARVNEFEIYAN